MQALVLIFTMLLSVAQSAQPAPSTSSNNKKRVILEERSEKGSIKETQETVESLTLLLKKTAPNPSVRRNVLLLNRAAALGLLARLKMIESSKTELAADSRKILNLSIKDATEVLNSHYSKSEQIMKAHDILGVSYLYLDENRKAREHFLQVLKMNPKPDKAGWIGLVIAEDYFDEENFKLAFEYYEKYLPLMSDQGKDLARYKMGWCMLNLNQPDEAEKYFAQVAKTKGTSGVGKDAIRDLAFLVTRRVDPLPSIDRAEKYFSNKPDRVDFLNAVRANLEGENSIHLHTLIVERLLALESDPEKALELALSNLRVQRKLYAAIDHMNAFSQVAHLIEVKDQKQSQALFQKYGDVVENELQALMKAYLDTFAGRTKTLEKLAKTDLAESLKFQFRFYNAHFSAKSGYPAVVSAWSDVCLDVKDWACVDEASEVVLSHPKELSRFFERAYLDQILSLERLISEKKTKDKSKLNERRDLRIHEFVEKFQKSPQWIRVAKLCSQSEMDHGRVEQAIPILSKILDQEPSDEAFYRLQYARFQLKKYQEIMSDPRAKNYLKPDSKVSELYRESSLALAQNAKGGKRAEDYKKNISEFVRLSNDPAKIRIARSDYFNFLNEQGRGDEAAQEFFALPVAEAKHPDWDNLRIDLWKQMIDKGRFEDALKLARLGSENSESFQRVCLTSLFVIAQVAPKEFSRLPDSAKEYFLGLFALTKPDWVVDFYREQKRELKKDEVNLVALAFKIKSNQWRLEKTSELETLLGTGYAFAENKKPPVGPLERQIDAVSFPDMKKLSTDEQTRSVQFILSQIHAVRAKVGTSLKGESPVRQLRVLEKARDLESKMASYLLNAPVPKQITSEQAVEYKNAMSKASEEFTEQAKQFEELAEKIRKSFLEEQKWLESRTLPAPDMKNWPWPSDSQKHPQLKNVFSLLTARNKLGALALLDYYREKFVKKDDDYFAIRSGLLLSDSPSHTLRMYVLDELEKNGQTKWVDYWKNLVGVKK